VEIVVGISGVSLIPAGIVLLALSGSVDGFARPAAGGY
jgi:hypothetical protein